MFSSLYKSVRDASVIRRLQFAANFYPRSMPKYWENVASFSIKTRGETNELNPEQARQIVENLEVIDKEALTTDDELLKEITTAEDVSESTGIVLISGNESCQYCGSQLHIRADRASRVTVYDDTLGTVLATHYTKYCRRRGCSFQQHYGYHAQGNVGEMRYDKNWFTLPYFLSTRETAFSTDMLRRLDKEILIGQISYKQRADIFNEVHTRLVDAHVEFKTITLQNRALHTQEYACTCTIANASIHSAV